MSSLMFCRFASMALIITPLEPQIIHNYRRQSTEGLSSLMLVFFLLGALTPTAYYLYSDQPFLLTASWMGFSVVSVLILCQVRYYRALTTDQRDHLLVDDTDQAPSDTRSLASTSVTCRRTMFVTDFLLIALVSTALVVALYYLFIYTSTTFIPSVMGLVLPVVFNFAGFCCQFAVIIECKSSEGVALGFTLIDLTACTLSITTICLHQVNIAALAPCCSIITCQFILMLFRFVIYPQTSTPKEEEEDADPRLLTEE